MKLQKLLSHTRRAIDTYKMIEEGDKIAIGISGGQDSLALLYALANLRRFYPKKFEIVAITINLGFPGFETNEINKLCEKLDVQYYVENTEIYDIIFNYRKESNPCSLCAKMRKGALNDKITELGCNKIAYAHHKDDIIETFIMSLISRKFTAIYLDRSADAYKHHLCLKGEIKAFERDNHFLLSAKCPLTVIQKRICKNSMYYLEKKIPAVKKKYFQTLNAD